MRKELQKGDIRLSAGLTLTAVGKTALWAANEDGLELLEGEVFVEVVRVVQNPHQFLDLERRFSASQIDAAMNTLQRLGIIQTRTASTNPLIDAFWDSTRLTPPHSPRVRLKSFLPYDPAWLRAAMQANGITLDDSSGLLVVVTDDYLQPNIAGLAANTSKWLLAKPIGHTLWMGPLFVEGRTVCWNCFAHWLRTNRHSQAFIGGSENDSYLRQTSTAALPSTFALAAGLLATTVSMWSARTEYRELENTILTLDTRNLTWSRHVIRPAPECRHCAERQTLPLQLGDLVSGICGIVSHLTVSSGPFASVFAAHAQLAPPLPVTGSRPALRHITVSGRGATQSLAEQSCIGEAVERYSTIFQGTEPRRLSRLADLDHAAIPPSDLFLFSDSQYRGREAWNRTNPEMFAVPHRVEADAEIEWTTVTSLRDGALKYVPSAYCYLWFQANSAPEIYSADSTGCAAGQDRDAAILAALLELIERDAVSIWWDNRLRRPSWEIAALASPQLKSCCNALAEQGRKLELLDITTDLGVPVCAAVAARFDGSEPHFAAAAALHPDVAAVRAAGELAQLLFWDPSRLTEECRLWSQTANVQQHSYLVSTGNAPPPAALRSVDDCLQAVTHVGLDPLVLDLTRPEIGIPVVRVIAPGLRHPWGRYAPGRLYDVPVHLRWLPHATPEAALNPSLCIL